MSSENIEVKEINKNIDHRTIPRVFFVCIRGIRVLFLVCICVCVMWLFSPFLERDLSQRNQKLNLATFTYKTHALPQRMRTSLV